MDLKAGARRALTWARVRAPGPVRTAYRLARSLESQPLSPALPDALVSGARVCGSREDMLAHLPKGGIVAELGTYRGDFARAIRRLNAPRELHLIDIDYSLFDAAGLEAPAVVRHTGLTHEVVAGFPDAHFDWVYVDADHAYASAVADAAAAAPKVKPGGYLVFNDFAHIDPYLGRYGVHRAVTEFAVRERWPVAFFAFHPAALYDIALRRPL